MVYFALALALFADEVKTMTSAEVPDSLTTPACQLRFGFIPSKPGELRLAEGLVTLAIGGEQVFRVSPVEARAVFPRVTFLAGLPLPGTGINLTVAGTTYWLSLVPFGYDRNLGGGGTWTIAWGDIKPARARVRQWRAAFGQP